jgi:hypothetical protein
MTHGNLRIEAGNSFIPGQLAAMWKSSWRLGQICVLTRYPTNRRALQWISQTELKSWLASLQDV